jgi:Carboxypeptidase regulatory-like domain
MPAAHRFARPGAQRSAMRTTLPLILLAALTFSAQAAAPPTGSVRGVIFNEVGRPKSRALVTRVGTDEYRAYTDEDGHFQIDGIPAGHQYFYILHPDMNEATFDITIVAGDTITIRPIYMRPFGLSDSLAAAESIGVDVPWAQGALTCAIRPAQKIFHVGDQPKFQVSITNRGNQPLDLVYAVDGGGWVPQAQIHLEILTIEAGHISGSNSQLLKGGTFLASCGNRNGLSANDFIHLKPGESMDPYAVGRRQATHGGTFQYPGTYRANFRYSTQQPDVRRWLGFGQSSIDPRMSKLLRTVPLVELTDSTEFEVAD